MLRSVGGAEDGFAPGFWQRRGSPVLIMWGSPIWGPAFFTSIRELVKGNHSYRTRRKKVDTEQANKYINKWMNIYIYIYTSAGKIPHVVGVNDF